MNWNSGRQLRECLESLARADKWGIDLQRVTVVDNASFDGSADGLEKIVPNLRLIFNSVNRGFAAACNEGAGESCADYLLFLNPDATLSEESLVKAVQFMRLPSSSGIGVCGIRLAGEGGKISRSCSRFPTAAHFYAEMFGLTRLFPLYFKGNLMVERDHSESMSVDVVTGAFFLVRRPVFKALGGFDERFFVYLEDVDFAYRAHLAGWKSYYFAGVQAFHRGGGCSRQSPAERLFYSAQSRILYGFKRFTLASALTLTITTLLVEPFSRLVLAIARRSAKELGSTLGGYWLLWRSIPSLLQRTRMGAERSARNVTQVTPRAADNLPTGIYRSR